MTADIHHLRIDGSPVRSELDGLRLAEIERLYEVSIRLLLKHAVMRSSSTILWQRMQDSAKVLRELTELREGK